MERIENLLLKWINLHNLQQQAISLVCLTDATVVQTILSTFDLNFCDEDSHVLATLEQFINGNYPNHPIKFASVREKSPAELLRLGMLLLYLAAVKKPNWPVCRRMQQLPEDVQVNIKFVLERLMKARTLTRDDLTGVLATVAEMAALPLAAVRRLLSSPLSSPSDDMYPYETQVVSSPLALLFESPMLQEVMRLNKALDAAQRKVEECRRQVDAANDDADEAKLATELSDGRAAEHRRRVQELQSVLRQYRAENSELHSQLSEPPQSPLTTDDRRRLQHHTKLQDENEALGARLFEAELDRDRADAELQNVRGRHERATGELRQLGLQHHQLQLQAELLRDDVGQWAARVTELQQQLAVGAAMLHAAQTNRLDRSIDSPPLPVTPKMGSLASELADVELRELRDRCEWQNVALGAGRAVIESTRVERDKAVQSLQAAKSDGELARLQQGEAAASLQVSLDAARCELETVRVDREKAVQSLQAILQSAKSEAECARLQHEQEVQAIQVSLRAAQAQTDAAGAEREEVVDSLRVSLEKLSEKADRERDDLQSQLTQTEAALKRAYAELRGDRVPLATLDAAAASRPTQHAAGASRPAQHAAAESRTPSRRRLGGLSCSRAGSLSVTDVAQRHGEFKLPAGPRKSVSQGDLAAQRRAPPQGVGVFFSCDEEQEVFRSPYMQSLKDGHGRHVGGQLPEVNVDGSAALMTEAELRNGESAVAQLSELTRRVAQLSELTRLVALDSPAHNIRAGKRKSATELLSDSVDSNSSTGSVNSKRRRSDQLQVELAADVGRRS